MARCDGRATEGFSSPPGRSLWPLRSARTRTIGLQAYPVESCFPHISLHLHITSSRLMPAIAPIQGMLARSVSGTVRASCRPVFRPLPASLPQPLSSHKLSPRMVQLTTEAHTPSDSVLQAVQNIAIGITSGLIAANCFWSVPRPSSSAIPQAESRIQYLPCLAVSLTSSSHHRVSLQAIPPRRRR